MNKYYFRTLGSSKSNEMTAYSSRHRMQVHLPICLILHISVCLYMLDGVCVACATTHVWRPENSNVEEIHFLYIWMGLGNYTEGITLGLHSRYCWSLSHLTSTRYKYISSYSFQDLVKRIKSCIRDKNNAVMFYMLTKVNPQTTKKKKNSCQE